MIKKNTGGNNIDKPEYKFEDICAGLKCSNPPTSILKVKYINKSGSFCKQCTSDLLQLELAEEILKGSMQSSIFEESCVNNFNSTIKPRLKEMAN
jgi:hypothetical protein